MLTNPVPGTPDRVKRLVEKLKAAREHSAGAGEAQLKRSLREALDEETTGLAATELEGLLRTARDSLVAEAREATAGERLSARVRELEAELERTRAERDELRALPQPSVRREGNATHVDEVLGELSRFAVELEVKRIEVLLDLKLTYGPSVVITGIQRELGKRLEAALAGAPGALAELSRALDRLTGFLIGVYAALMPALSEGVELMLAELDPAAIRRKHAGRLMGTDWEKAFDEVGTALDDLRGSSPAELWNRYFERAFQGRLEAWK